MLNAKIENKLRDLNFALSVLKDYLSEDELKELQAEAFSNLRLQETQNLSSEIREFFEGLLWYFLRVKIKTSKDS